MSGTVPAAELRPGLHVVATPIGNLQDITLRALNVLTHATEILAEDTRRTRILLSAHGIHTPLRSLPAHSEASRSNGIVDAIAAGAVIALCTDAGMPGISDPGTLTVAAVRAAGLHVEVIPGASAVTAAIAGAGIGGGGGFTFLGFPPRSPGKLRRAIGEALDGGRPVVFFESPLRLARTMRAIKEVTGDRHIVVARELTKMHETWHEGTAEELDAAFTLKQPRGECTIVVTP